MGKKKTVQIASAVVPAKRKKAPGRWVKTKITIGGDKGRAKSAV